jgi:hypothetical protein
MVLAALGRPMAEALLRVLTDCSPLGTDAFHLVEAARQLGNWLRVFRSAEATRPGPDGSQQLQMQVGRLEKCVALRDGCGTSIGVIAACFARVLRGYSGRACMGFLLILQEVRRVCKTRNKFKGRGISAW